MDVSIQRTKISNGAFGEMTDEKGQHICMTMEHLFNGKPAIPAGTWVFNRYYSPHFKKIVFMSDTIPGHTKIELHVANFVEQLDGCVALGTQIGPRSEPGQNMLTKSEEAFDKFMALQVGVDTCKITFHD